MSASNEGEVYWTEIEDMKKADLADGMEKVLEVFLKENLSEYFFYKENNRWVDVLKYKAFASSADKYSISLPAPKLIKSEI